MCLVSPSPHTFSSHSPRPCIRVLLPIAVTMQIKLMGDQICGMRAREESKADGFKQTIEATDAKVGSSHTTLRVHSTNTTS